MQMIPLEEYSQIVRLEHARLDGMEEGMEKGMEKVARSMLEDGKSLPEVAKYTRLPLDRLQQMRPH